jgi:hypothetical protein
LPASSADIPVTAGTVFEDCARAVKAASEFR